MHTLFYAEPAQVRPGKMDLIFGSLLPLPLNHSNTQLLTYPTTPVLSGTPPAAPAKPLPGGSGFQSEISY